ncbi:hypothetical protein BDN72DRAFT_962655 [Pluteus cervinus]|uniref:Uncharacterized protein n=1 Tax=Pluteus cervinus TaxID=181527 RepID=A0ACD3AHL5_9AGAR|nr:hypothetical protein BDN72DRAFT_962655 [Pluteus cervinus]
MLQGTPSSSWVDILISRGTSSTPYKVAAGAQAVNRSSVASTAFLLWDILITFDDEVKVIWCNPWTPMKVLYFIIRYLSLFVQMSILLVGSSELSTAFHFALHDCFIWQTYECVAALVVILATDMVLILRVHALYHGNKVMQRVLGVLFIIEGAVMIVGLRLALPEMKFDDLCRVTEVPPMLLLALGPPLVFQPILFALTIFKYVQAVRAGWGDVPLIMLLMRDGTWAFFVLFFVLAGEAALFGGNTGTYAGLLYGWMLTAFSFCGYRILLNIHDLGQRPPVSLPVELERVIFELTARIDPPTALGLVRLSTYVSPWILPILYDTVVLGLGNRDAPPIASLERYGHCVRHLLIGQHQITVAAVAGIIHSCPNVTNFALWANLVFNNSVIEGLQRLPLTRLSIHLDSLFEFTEPTIPQAARIFPSFTQLTHLDVASIFPDDLSDCLQFLPRLTYLSLPIGTAEELEPPADIRSALPHLKFIVFLEHNVDDNKYSSDIEDCASLDELIITNCSVPNYVDDWRHGAKGETDVWESEFTVSLPVELERAIFELTAQIDPATAPSLALVSSYVSPWVLPIIYETVVVCLSSGGSDRPPIPSLERYGRYARHLLIGHYHSTLTVVTSIFASCPNVTHLAFWASLVLDEAAIEGLKRLPLIRLSIRIENIFSLSKSMILQAEQIFPSFPQLTHLDIVRFVPERLSDCLRYLPRLRYLSLPDDFNHSELESPEDTMKALPGLKFILLLGHNLDYDCYTSDIEDKESFDDQIIASGGVPNFVDDWRRAARGEVDIPRPECNVGIGLNVGHFSNG